MKTDRLIFVSLMALLPMSCKSKKDAEKQEQPSKQVAVESGDTPTIDAAPQVKKEDESANPGINDRYKDPEGAKKAISIFEEEDRAEYQKPAEIIENLQLKAGSTVCEIGAGSGYFTPHLSAAVGEGGMVIAEDVIDHFVEHLSGKIESLKLTNVEVVLGGFTDTKIGEDKCDVIAVFDVYHHFEYPEPMLASLASNLKDGGQMVIIDWYKKPNKYFEKWGLDVMSHLPLDKAGVIEQLAANNWKLTDDKDFLEYQYYLVFEEGVAKE